jgi:hypothetical protein
MSDQGETQHSHPVTFANVPEVTQFSAKFNYNFYTRRETNTTEQDSIFNDGGVEFSGNPHPRDIQLNWKIINLPKDDSLTVSSVLQLIRQNKDKIIFEGSLPSSRYTPVNLDNASLPNKVSNLIEIRRILEESSVSDLREIGISDEFSEIDLGQPFSYSALIQNQGSTLQASYNDTLSQFDNELNSILNFYSIQSDDLGEKDVKKIPYIGIRSFYPAEKPFLHLGFLITRFEINESGNEISRNEIVVGNPNTREYIDKTVIYGKKYSYEIRVVYQMVIPSIDPENNNGGIRYLTTLVASKPIRAYVIAEETEPPPPPDHIKFLWSLGENKLRILWNMPYNPQRDIKRFQVFRRESTQNAFELIHEIRFNDNISPEFISGIPENVPNNLWVKSQYTDYPDKTFVDPEFTKDSRYIYALCSIDARYYTSNYSEQFEVYFDKIRNKLVFKQISPRGAPKPYPNLYLKDEEIVEPALSISGIKSKRMNLIFSPQFYNCMNGGNPLSSPKILKNGVGKYNFHILNTDNQKDATVEISINDANNIIK